MTEYVEPQCKGEEGLDLYLTSRIDYLRVSDLVRIARLSDFLKWKAAICMRTIVQKIVLATGGGVTMRIYAANGREVYNKTACKTTMLRAIKYLKEMRVSPTEIDIKDYNHEPRDNILDVLNNFVSGVKKVSMACERCCNCSDECLRLSNMRLGNVYCISPPALMFTNVAGINELHIDAGLPSRCLELLHNFYQFEKSPAEIFKEFKDKLKMLVRSLTVTDIHTTSIKRGHLAAILGQMKVEELHLVKGPPPPPRPPVPRALAWFHPAGDAPPPLMDLKFAETQGEDQPRAHWNATDPKMNLKKLTYVGVDTLPCADVIAKLCAWFSVQKLLDITLPKKRTFEDLKDDLTATLPLLKAFTGDEIRIKWFCERAEDKIPKYDRLCNDITQLYKEDFPSLLPVKYSSEELFLLELRDKDGGAQKTLQFTFSIADPSAPEQVQVPAEAAERRAALIERLLAFGEARGQARGRPRRQVVRRVRRDRGGGDVEMEEQEPAPMNAGDRLEEILMRWVRPRPEEQPEGPLWLRVRPRDEREALFPRPRREEGRERMLDFPFVVRGEPLMPPRRHPERPPPHRARRLEEEIALVMQMEEEEEAERANWRGD